MRRIVMIGLGLLMCGLVYAYQPDYRMTPGGRSGGMSDREVEESFKRCLDSCNEHSNRRDFLKCYEECERIFKRGKRQYLRHRRGNGHRNGGPSGYTGVKG